MRPSDMPSRFETLSKLLKTKMQDPKGNAGVDVNHLANRLENALYCSARSKVLPRLHQAWFSWTLVKPNAHDNVAGGIYGPKHAAPKNDAGSLRDDGAQERAAPAICALPAWLQSLQPESGSSPSWRQPLPLPSPHYGSTLPVANWLSGASLLPLLWCFGRGAMIDECVPHFPLSVP